jgi:hypothetical protein
MRAPPAALVALVVAPSGCAPAPLAFDLPAALPPAALLALRSGDASGPTGAPLAVIAFEPSDAARAGFFTPLRRPPGPDPLYATLLEYPRPLDALHIPHGELAPTADGATLPRPDTVYTSTLGPGGASGWSPAPARLDGALATFRSADLGTSTTSSVAPCATFDLERIALPTSGDPQFALALDGDTVLLRTRGDYTLYRVHLSTGQTEALSWSRRSSDDTMFDALLTPSGRLWSGGFGAVYSGALSGAAFSEDILGTTTAAIGIDRLVGNGDESAPEIYAVSGQRLLRFDGTSWKKLYSFGGQGGLTQVIRLGPSEAMAISNGVPVVAHAFGTRVREEATPSIGIGFLSIASIPGLGVVAGDLNGTLYQRDGAGMWYKVLDELQLAYAAIEAIAPYQSGYVVAANGSIVEWRPGQGFCPLQPGAHGGAFEILVLGDDLIVPEKQSADLSGTVITVLRRRAP